MMMLEVDGLSVRYGRLTALRGISLKVDEGQIVCIIGPNGAGKSTTLAAIAGGVGIQSGTVRWRNQVISGLSRMRSKPRLCRRNFPLQERNLLEPGTGKIKVSVACKSHVSLPAFGRIAL